MPANVCAFQKNAGSVYFFQSQQCTGADALPFAFPPAGYALINQYQNRTSGDVASTCTEGTEVYKYQAAASGACTTVFSSTGSQQTFANNAFAANVMYSDAACANQVSATIQPVSCSSGDSIVSIGNIGAIPKNLPTEGYTEYAKDDTTCSNAPSSIQLYVDGTCSNGKKFFCVNGGTQVNVTTYESDSCMGSPSQLDVFAAGTSAAPAACTSSSEDAPRRYFCSFDSSYYAGSIDPAIPSGASGASGPSGASGTGSNSTTSSTGPLGSSSTASVSIVSIVLVAMAAVFGRQL